MALNNFKCYYLVPLHFKGLKQSVCSKCSSAQQVKVWFQNRRTKHKRERLGNAGNDVISMTSSAESDDYVDVDSLAHVTSG